MRQKFAGLLKVPEQTLKEVQDWAASAYCKVVYSSLDKMQYHFNNRNDVKNTINKILESNNYKSLMKIVSSGSQNINDILPEVGTAFDLNISYFAEEENDPKTGRAGVYDWVRKPPTLQIFIYGHADQKYNFRLYINYQGYQVSTDLLKNIDRYEVKEYIKNNREGIFEVLTNFKYFVNNFEAFDDYDFKEIKKIKIELMRHIKPEYNIEQIIKVPAQYIIGNSNVNSIDFKAVFIYDRDTAKSIYKEEKWRGLWDARNSWDERNNTDILGGNLYVFKDLTDWDKEGAMPSVHQIQRDLEGVKQTARHELQHVIQTFAMEYKQTELEFGLPPVKIREKEHDIHGLKLQDQKSNDRLEHRLRDIEFYTNLTDAVDEFRRLLNNLPSKLHKDALKAYIHLIDINDLDKNLNNNEYFKNKNSWNMKKILLDRIYKAANNNFFDTLKDARPAKYRKAVIEFIKAFPNLV